MYHNGSSSAKKSSNNDETTSFRVLVVDDDRVLRTLHEAMLTRLGFQVELAADGKEAVDLHLAGASYNLILMDLQMPVMDGSQATKELRAMGVTSSIVGVTDCGHEMAAFMAAGLTDCVSKPLVINKIAAYFPASTDDSNN